VYVAVGSGHLSGIPDAVLPNGRIFYSPSKGQVWHDRGSAQLDLTIQGQVVQHRGNPANAIVIDPQPPHRVYIGCNIGVFFTGDQGQNWTHFSDGLPNAPIADLQFHPTRRLLRAATTGRSVWEISVDAPPAPADVHVFVRDNILDAGTLPTPALALDPLEPGAQTTWVESLDIKVDTPFPIFGGFRTPKSTVDYTPGGAADFIAFQEFGTDDPRNSKTSRVYLQVQNRGPGDAISVSARIFFAHKGGADFPQLQADFWTVWQDPDASKFTGEWKPIGELQTVPVIKPTEPAIVRWDWSPPGGLADPAGLLAVVSALGDPVTTAVLNVEQLARNDKHAALKQVGVGAPDAAFVVLGILIVAGVAVGIGVALS
jgi:hypothetical protein